MGTIHPVGPNEAKIVTGKRKKKFVTGGWIFAPSKLSHVQQLSLTLMTLNPNCRDVETLEGVPIHVSGICQCKIMSSPQFLLIAAEQFLGKRRSHIASAIQQTLEGHLRAILGTLTVEEVYKDRIKFADLVREVAATDVAKMGIQIVSFVIKDVDDSVGYLFSLGKSRSAEVKRDARIGVAKAERDAGIKEAECEKEANAVIFQSKMKIQNYSRMYHLEKAEFDREVNAAKAEAELAFTLKLAIIQQQIRYEELAIAITEKKKLIEIEHKEIERKDRELTATVKLSSEAESYRIQTIAQGQKLAVVENAIGESERIKLIGEAEANQTKVVGLKKADQMLQRAIRYQSYGDAAKKQLVLNYLPEIASKISAPLAKTEEIILLGGSNTSISENLIALAGQIPPAMDALGFGNVKKKISNNINQ